VPLNDEIGHYQFTAKMDDGRFCFPLAQYSVEVEIHLRKTEYSPFIAGSSEDEIIADVVTNPTKTKQLEIRSQADRGEARQHAVCTVLTFKNKFTGTHVSFIYLLRGFSCLHLVIILKGPCYTCLPLIIN
jgi:hypothetical protein